MPVLVVDDESVTRRVVSYALKPMSVDVVEAQNGEEALVHAKEQNFALVLVDINLPDIDGFELIEQMKALPHLKDAPMLIFTARNHPEDEEMAQAVGAAGLFYKPFSTKQLRELVAKYV